MHSVIVPVCELFQPKLCRASGFVATKLFHSLITTIGLPKVSKIQHFSFES